MSHVSGTPLAGVSLASAPAVFGAAPLSSGLRFRELTYALPTQTLDIEGVEVAYHERGMGERSLLLIHGLGSYLPVWSRMLDALAETHRVVAIDLPGYGRSGRPGGPYSMARFAAIVDGVIQRLALGSVALCGHSMGGQIAMTHALNYPGKAAALCLLAPAGFEPFTPQDRQWMTALITPASVMATPPETVRANLLANFCVMPKEAAFMITDRLQIIGGPDFAGYAEAVASSVAAMLDEPVLHRLDEIRVPTLLVFGEEDRLIPNPVLHPGPTQAVAEGGASLLPDARLLILPRTGHMVPFERPVETVHAMREFLASRAP